MLFKSSDKTLSFSFIQFCNTNSCPVSKAGHTQSVDTKAAPRIVELAIRNQINYQGIQYAPRLQLPKKYSI